MLALGNDLLGDDGVGVKAAREIQQEAPAGVDVIETAEAGLALMELLSGYRRALLLDSVQTGTRPPGTIVEFGPRDFRSVIAPSPHYAGLPEVIALAERLQVPFPGEIRILAMEIENPREVKEDLSPPVSAALPAFVEKARGILSGWRRS